MCECETMLNTGFVNNKWTGGIVAGEHISAYGVMLENSAIYICTVAITGTANKDGGVYVAPVASTGSAVFLAATAPYPKNLSLVKM